MAEILPFRVRIALMASSALGLLGVALWIHGLGQEIPVRGPLNAPLEGAGAQDSGPRATEESGSAVDPLGWEASAALRVSVGPGDLAGIRAVVVDRHRGEPVPFLRLLVTDEAGVTVEVVSDGKGRCVSGEWLKGGDIHLEILGGVSAPSWLRTVGSRNKSRRSAFSHFDGSHRRCPGEPDVWVVESSRLVPLELEGVPSTVTRLGVLLDASPKPSIQHGSIVEQAGFNVGSTVGSSTGTPGTHFLVTGSERRPEESDSFHVDIDRGRPGVWLTATERRSLSVWSMERAHEHGYERQALVYGTSQKLFYAGVVRCSSLPTPGEEPLHVALEPVTSRVQSELEAKYGSKLARLLLKEAFYFDQRAASGSLDAIDVGRSKGW